MTYRFTPGLLAIFPTVDELMMDVKKVVCSLDRDICTRDLHVEAQKNPNPAYYQGWAYPVTRYFFRNRTLYHRDGLIWLLVGSECDEADIVRLYAHELRHIGQFHRGRKRYGSMTILPLSPQQSEEDAEEFEDRVLERVL